MPSHIEINKVPSMSSLLPPATKPP